MATLTLYRCDNCGQTQESRDNWFEVGIAAELYSAFNSHYYAWSSPPRATKVLVCSFGCARGWIDTRAESEWEKIKAASAVDADPDEPRKKRKKK